MIGQLSSSWWIFILLGIGAGIISGTLGLGSGTIVVPALVLLFDFGQKNAQGTALAVMVPMALVGALRYWQNPEIELNMVVIGLIICGSIAGALVGVELASMLPAHVLRRVFAIFLIIVAVRMFMTSEKSRRVGLDNNMIEQKTVSSLEHGETNNKPEI